MKSAAFEYLRPSDLDDALALLDADTRPFLGGQSLSPMMNLRLARPARLLDLKPLGLRDFTLNGPRFHLGAGITHAAIEDGLAAEVSAGLLPHIARGIAYRGVRNRGTLGGSLAHADPAADWLTMLMLLDGEVRTDARRIPADEFCTGAYGTALRPGEILLAVTLTRLSPAARWGWCKINRKTGAFADALAGAVLDGGWARVVVGAIDAPPLLLPATSAALRVGGPAAAVGRDECEALLRHLDADGRRLRAVAVARALEMLA